jgi:hypothetical protein
VRRAGAPAMRCTQMRHAQTGVATGRIFRYF